MIERKSWIGISVVAIVCLLIAAGAAIYWTSHEQKVQAAELPNAARIERVDGDVGLDRTLNNNNNQSNNNRSYDKNTINNNQSNGYTTNDSFVQATPNTPVSVGDRLSTRDNSQVEVAFDGRNSAKLNANSSLDFLTLTSDKTQVALREGSGVFEVSNLPSGNLFEVATPCGAVDVLEPGLYQIELNSDGVANATALSGSAQIVSASGTAKVSKGETMTVACQGSNGQAANQGYQGSTGAALSRVEPTYAAHVVDDYYRYHYPRTYDGRYSNYDAYLNDPYYYDPYRRYVSYQYVDDEIPGLYDLDYYGDWQTVGDYGYCWHPRGVEADWVPYQTGYWETDYPFG